MPQHNQTTGEVLHFPDYPQGPRFVRPMSPEMIARILGEDRFGQDGPAQKPWPYDKDYGDIPPGVAAAEMLVEFFRERAGRIGIALYVLGVSVAMYFAFQIGRGVL